MVLVIVLWTIALCSALAMATSVTFRSFAGIAAIDRDRTQGDALLSAGLEVAADIATDWKENPLLERTTTFALSTGTVHARINDEGGRIDIGKAPPDVLSALMRSVGAPPAQADSVAQLIVTWRSRDEAPSATPATTAPGTAAPGTAAPANAAPATTKDTNIGFFTDVGQLAEIPGMRPEWVAAIRPLTTVFGAETVNPLTAPAAVIAALPGVDRGQVEAFLAARRSSPNDATQLGTILGAAQRFVAPLPQQVVSVELAASLADGYGAAARAVIVLLPRDSEPYRVLVFTPIAASSVL
jgi:general secretion pathway protein K